MIRYQRGMFICMEMNYTEIYCQMDLFVCKELETYFLEWNWDTWNSLVGVSLLVQIKLKNVESNCFK